MPWINGRWQDDANPNDPNQLLQWSLGEAQANKNRMASNTNTIDPGLLAELSKYLSGIFGDQRKAFSGDFNSSMTRSIADAENRTGAMSMFQGRNLASNVFGAGSQVRSQMTPGYTQGLSSLFQGQNTALLSAARQTKMTQQQGGSGYADALARASQVMDERNNRPDIWSYLAGGLGQGLQNIPNYFKV